MRPLNKDLPPVTGLAQHIRTVPIVADFRHSPSHGVNQSSRNIGNDKSSLTPIVKGRYRAATVSAFLTVRFCRWETPTVNHRTIDSGYRLRAENPPYQLVSIVNVKRQSTDLRSLLQPAKSIKECGVLVRGF